MLKEKVKNVLSRLNHRRKTLLMAAAVLALAFATVGGTLALQYVVTDAITNKFTKAEVQIDIPEKVENNYKKSVKVENVTGENAVPAYIRVAVVANTVDENGNITGNADVSAHFAGTDWLTGSDGLYYYTKVVQPGETTGELLDLSGEKANGINLSGIQVTILAEGIQAEGGAAADAWGVILDVNGNITAGGKTTE